MEELTFLIGQDVDLDNVTLSQIKEFYDGIPTLEKELDQKIILHTDKKTDTVFIEVHVTSSTLSNKMDLEAVIDPQEQEDYRANRKLQPKNPFYLQMLEDAKQGRQFSDIVIEYNTSYEPSKPLKILGGQHRSSAIKHQSPPDKYHGIRVYFNLDIKKRVELYTISNTNIQVPPDLIDRLNEQSLNPPNKLRDFAHEIGILKKNEDFGEKKTADDPFIPTVRIMRTFVVDFYKGKNYTGTFDEVALVPYLCTSGGMDNEYQKLYEKIPSFKNEKELLTAGKNFVRLHSKQWEIIEKSSLKGKKEYRVKALSPAIVSSWAFAAGLLQSNPKRLDILYKLPDRSGSTDPLNAAAMSKARSETIDSETYRGLGTRSESSERGRLLQLFLLYSNSNKNKITLEMCNTAIDVFHAIESQTRAAVKKKKAFG